MKVHVFIVVLDQPKPNSNRFFHVLKEQSIIIDLTIIKPFNIGS
mgnify:CR=1 FL=1